MLNGLGTIRKKCWRIRYTEHNPTGHTAKNMEYTSPDQSLENGERSLEMDYYMRAEAGDGDIDWDKDPFDDDGDDDEFDEDDW